MISVERQENGTYVVTAGHRRLMALLKLVEHVEVWDQYSSKVVHVHQVDGKLFALSPEAQANLEDQAQALINRVRG